MFFGPMVFAVLHLWFNDINLSKPDAVWLVYYLKDL